MPRTSEPRPAPGDLAWVQAFVNTTTPERGDELTSPRRLADWLSRHRLLDTGAELDEEDLGRALDARSGIRALVLATTVGGEADAEELARLQRAAVGASAGIRMDSGGPEGFASAAQGLGDALGTLLAAIVAARLAGQWALLKLCARDGCRRAFYDASQSRTGKWCTARCGDRVRAAAYRGTEWYKLVFK
ncbi:MAG: CGNR zinc finger domain-containing protein [bacterium]|nr:CGNR zinc finger domain-containing protein [bacterium]